MSMMAEVCANPGPPMCIGLNRKEVKYPFFKGPDLNSFLFLFCDNMASILGILLALLDIPKIARNCWGAYCGLGTSTGEGPHVQAFEDMIFQKVVPGIGIAIFVGNIWYGWMAFKLAGFEKRVDVTALPYGINTPAGFLTAFNIMLPICFKYGSITDPILWADKAWKGGAAACLCGGILEICGAWLGPIIAKFMCRAALFCPVGCVGFVWLGMVPFISVMAEPIKGAIPLALAFVGFYGARGKGLPFLGVPMLMQINFIIILLFGTIFKWVGAGKFDDTPANMWALAKSRLDKYAFKNKMGAFVILEGIKDLGASVTIIIPISLAAFIETMENVELAAQKGDQYNMREAMICDGVGSCMGALFGSIVPTTCYIGHSRHKMIGATAGYSIVNGTVYLLICMFGLLPFIATVLDDVAVNISLVAVGLMIIQDALELTHPRHIPAYCCGLFFVIADPWNFDMRAPATTAYCTRSVARMNGLKNMWPGGGIMCSLVTTQILCDLTDAKFIKCSVFCVIATLLSLFGLMHGNNSFTPDGTPTTGGPGTGVFAGEGDLTVTYMDGDYKTGKNEGYRFCIMYSLIALYCMVHAGVQKMKPANLEMIPGLGFCPSADDPDGLNKKSPPWKADEALPTSTPKTAEA